MKNSSINKPPTQAKSVDFTKEWSYKSECTFSHFKQWCREAEYLVLSNYGDLDAFVEQPPEGKSSYECC